MRQAANINLILSETACLVAKLESGIALEENDPIQNKRVLLAHLGLESEGHKLTLWSNDNLAARVASGSNRMAGMLILPASVGVVGRIASGVSSGLVERTADVCLKERFPLVVAVRETPLSNIHLRNMLTVSEAGAIILPAMPAFYQRPETLQDLVDFVVGKAFDALHIEHQLFKRWLQA